MKQIWLHFCCDMDTLLVSVRLFGFVITLIFLIVQKVNQKKKRPCENSWAAEWRQIKTVWGTNLGLAQCLANKKRTAGRLEQIFYLSLFHFRQSPQQTPSARLSTQHRTLEFMERRFRISPHFKLLKLKVCALGVTSFWSRTRDLRWLSLMWSQWWPSVMTIRGRAWLKPQNIQSQTVHLFESLSMVLKLSSTPWNLKQVEKSGHQKRNYSSA